LPPGHHPALPESHSCHGCCRICTGRAESPSGPIHSQEPRRLARAAPSLTAGAARGPSARRRWRQSGTGACWCAAQAQGRALAQSCACRLAPREEPGATWRPGAWPGPGRQVACPGLETADARSSPPLAESIWRHRDCQAVRLGGQDLPPCRRRSPRRWTEPGGGGIRRDCRLPAPYP
jgi:hypothetical protein